MHSRMPACMAICIPECPRAFRNAFPNAARASCACSYLNARAPQFQTFAPFKAFFTIDSAPVFNVFPAAGTLAPYGSDGTQFVVSFLCKE